MAVNPVQWALSHPAIVLTGALALIGLAWAYEAYDEAEDRGEALEGFGMRAKSGTGGALNVVLAAVVSVVGWAATTFSTAGEAIQFVLGLAPHFPVLSASVVTIGLGALGLSDVIVLRASHFVGLSVLALLVAVAYRTNFGKVSLP